MVFTVRCFKCGAQEVRLVLGGRAILHARCQSCDTNLLEEVLQFETAVQNAQQRPKRERKRTVEMGAVDGGNDGIGSDETVAADD